MRFYIQYFGTNHYVYDTILPQIAFCEPPEMGENGVGRSDFGESTHSSQYIQISFTPLPIEINVTGQSGLNDVNIPGH